MHWQNAKFFTLMQVVHTVTVMQQYENKKEEGVWKDGKENNIRKMKEEKNMVKQENNLKFGSEIEKVTEHDVKAKGFF